LSAVLLIGEPAADPQPRPSPRADCTDSKSAVPSEYWFYHALAASHPPLFDPRTGSTPCPARKVIRT
jgi:hypothetical protein